jgi:hypothetical protein
MTPQRFVDHGGWWRNRRAVRVEDDGLVIERLIGGEMHVPWAEVIGLHWTDADALRVATPHRSVRFDRHVEGVEALAQAISEARDTVSATPGAAAVALWLGAAHEVEARIGAAATGRVRWAVLAWPLIFAACLAITVWYDASPQQQFPLLTVGFLVLTIVAVLSGGTPHLRRHRPRTRSWHDAHADAGKRYTLTVDADGVTLRSQRNSRRFAWTEIQRCDAVSGGLRLTPFEGAALFIPDAPRFRHATEAIWRVMRGMSGFYLDDAPPPPGAISLARLNGDEPLDNRGLSRVEPEDAP